MDEEDYQDSVGSWLRHPFTLHVRKGFEKAVYNATMHVLNECKGSTDPRVTAAYARLEALKEVIEAFTQPSSAEARRQR